MIPGRAVLPVDQGSSVTFHEERARRRLGSLVNDFNHFQRSGAWMAAVQFVRERQRAGRVCVTDCASVGSAIDRGSATVGGIDCAKPVTCGPSLCDAVAPKNPPTIIRAPAKTRTYAAGAEVSGYSKFMSACIARMMNGEVYHPRLAPEVTQRTNDILAQAMRRLSECPNSAPRLSQVSVTR